MRIVTAPLAALAGAAVLAGCGNAVSLPQPHLTSPSAPSLPSSPATPSPAPSSSAPSGSGSAVAHTSVPATTSSRSAASSAPASPTPPAPPGTGSYTELKISVTKVVPEGTAYTSGHALNLYLLDIKVTNPTSAIITMALNDFSAVSATSQAYSWNDYAETGLSSSNSFFPFPVTPASPQSTQVDIFPNQSRTGAVTVQVAPATQYQLIWGSAAAAVPGATFYP